MDRRRLLDALTLITQRRFAHFGRGDADRAILGLLALAPRTMREAFQKCAESLGHREPGKIEKQRQADRDRDQHDHRRAGKADTRLQKLGDRTADDAARQARQRRLQLMQPQRLEAYCAEKQQHKADAVRVCGQIVVQWIAAGSTMQLAKSAQTVIASPNTSR